MHNLLRCSFVVFAAAVVAWPARAQETASDTLLTVDHYLDWEQVADPQLSPDGAQVVYTRRRSEEHTSELQSRLHLVCRLLLEKKKKDKLPSLCCTLTFP